MQFWQGHWKKLLKNTALISHTQLSNYRAKCSWKEPARAGIFTLTIGSIYWVSFWGFVCLWEWGGRWQGADPRSLAGCCGQKKENKVRRMHFLNAPWCAILKFIFPWKKVTNIKCRNVLEVIFSLSKTISISLREKRLLKRTTLFFIYTSLFFHPMYFLSIRLYSSLIMEVESKWFSVSKTGPILQGHVWNSPSMFCLSQNVEIAS